MVGRVVLSGWTCAAPGTVAAGAGPGDEGSFGGGAGVVAVGDFVRRRLRRRRLCPSAEAKRTKSERTLTQAKADATTKPPPVTRGRGLPNAISGVAFHSPAGSPVRPPIFLPGAFPNHPASSMRLSIFVIIRCRHCTYAYSRSSLSWPRSAECRSRDFRSESVSCFPRRPLTAPMAPFFIGYLE